MGVLRRERRKWEELKRASKSLSKRFASTKIRDDEDDVFCTDKRRLDRELQVARNMNPRLRDPLPFEQQYFSTFQKSYNKRTEQACDVYDVNRIARKKEDFSWYEPDMKIASSFRSSKRTTSAKNKMLSTIANAKRDARRVKPPSYGHRPGSAGRHFDTLSMEVTRTPARLADHQHLMTVEQLFVMLHTDPVRKSEVALAETAPTPALAKTFHNMLSTMKEAEPPKFQVNNGKPVAGGLLNRSVSTAVSKSRRRRRNRRSRALFDDEADKTPDFNNRLHLGARKTKRAINTRTPKAPSNTLERVTRYQRMAAGIENSPFCPQRDELRSTTLEQNLMDHPTFLAYMTRKQIKRIISKPLQNKEQNDGGKDTPEGEDLDEPPPPPSEPPPQTLKTAGPETKTPPPTKVTRVRGNDQKKAQLSVYDSLGMLNGDDSDSDSDIGY